MKIDPYKHKERYINWKNTLEQGIKGISKENSDIVINYVTDMENGLNVSRASQKGSRSYIRLNNLKQRLVFLSKQFENYYKVTDLTKITEEQLFTFFNGMRNGTIMRLDGKEYQSVSDYVKVFKAFWHWYIKVSKKKGKEVQDLTTDLDTSIEKPRWVYLTEAQVKQLCDNAKFEYRVLMMFLYDTGIRAPTELVNLRVSDLYSDYKEIHIRDEIRKTFGRRIKLMLCSDLVKSYVKSKGLKESDQIFGIKPVTVNKYIQRLATRVLGEAKSQAGQKYSELTMYDFRHCSCCYWLPRYKSESALKYRFGWKKSEKIHYYSELLGMKDTIAEEDLLVDVTKTEIEKRLERSEKEKEIMQERFNQMERQMQKLLELSKIAETKIELIAI